MSILGAAAAAGCGGGAGCCTAAFNEFRREFKSGV
jgi:hypothetical protein